LQQVEKFNYLELVFTSDGRPNKKINTRVCKSSTVLLELYLSVLEKRALSKTAKLSVFKSIVVTILAYGQ